MKKDKKKACKLEIKVDLKRVEKYHFVGQMSDVFFPYQPYEQQISMVSSLHSAIKNKENALIESPTGTGKTLCLLIGSLSALINLQDKKKIYYLTRTHSQISQVVNELKKTVYSCNVNIIASRQLLCLNYNVSQLKGKQLEKACGELCMQKLCAFRDFQYSKIPKNMELNEFREYCKKELICPYFYSKQLTEKCQLTIMPFNYLLDWNLFQKNHIDLKDSVIIFDEAHNIDTLCEQGSDIRITQDLLFQAIAELKLLLKSSDKKALLKQFRNSGDQHEQIKELKEQIEHFSNCLKNSEEITFISKMDFIQKIQKFTESHRSIGVDLGNYEHFCGKIKRIMKDFYKKCLSCQNLGIFAETIQRIFKIVQNNEEYNKFSITLIKGQILFRCLDPSICFKRLINSKPRSIILSSGTMGNLDVWQKNLKIPFKHKVITQSFITKNQLYAQVKSESKNGVTFNFSYQGKNVEKQYEELCKELAGLQKVVDGGIIVAFSNYELLEKTLKYSTILEKKVFFETKGGNIEDIYKLYSNQVQNNGAFLFIIIRGRFSQGINFTDKLCRCLIIIGIPFLPLKDPSIVQKMKYLQDNQKRESADTWYTQQSFKSLNQTLGRAIRNKNDYAVVLLFDQRYLKQEIICHLSGWFKNCLNSSKNGISQIKSFLEKDRSQKILEGQEEQRKVETKNKKEESNICQRLQQFSTPSKGNRKKLKLKFETEQKTKKTDNINKKSIDLRQIHIEDEEKPQKTHSYLNQQMADFFISSQRFPYFTSTVKLQEETNSFEPSKIEVKAHTKTSGKIRYDLDF